MDRYANTLSEIDFQVSLLCIARPGEAPLRQIEEMRTNASAAASGQWSVVGKDR